MHEYIDKGDKSQETQFGIHPLTFVGGRAVECGPTADL